MKLLVVLAVGLRPKDLAHAPALRGLGEHGFAAPLTTVFPAVTCTVQATFLTGLLPREHGAVGNGWYFKDHAQALLWRAGRQGGSEAEDLILQAGQLGFLCRTGEDLLPAGLVCLQVRSQ